MAWLAVDKGGKEYIYQNKPIRKALCFAPKDSDDRKYVKLLKGTIKFMLGYNMTWKDEPLKL